MVPVIWDDGAPALEWETRSQEAPALEWETRKTRTQIKVGRNPDKSWGEDQNQKKSWGGD